MKSSRQHAACLLAAAALVVVLLSACAKSDSTQLLGYVPPSPINVADVSATEAGSTSSFSFVAAPGELLVVYFGYTNCPDLCPATMVAVRNAKRKIGDLAPKVDLAMVTVDPARDTADVLPKYLSSFSSRYHALVPVSEDELAKVQDAFQATSSVTKKADGSIEVTHSTVTYVVDESGTVLVEWPFGTDAESMAHDLEILFAQKGKT